MKIKYNSPVILTFALISIGVMAFATITGQNFVYRYFSSPTHIAASNPLFYFKMLSYIAGHGSWSHLTGNFIMILLIGPLLEEKYGSGKLLEMILVTAAVTSILNLLLFSNSIAGASGIVFMLIILASFANIKTGQVPLTFIIIAVLYLSGEVTASLKADGISQFSHLAGGFLGACYGFVRT